MLQNLILFAMLWDFWYYGVMENFFKQLNLFNQYYKAKILTAMTLAEIIIVIGVIGIVAEIVLPQIITDVQEAQYKTAKDKVRMSIAEAGRILSVTGEITGSASAEDFVKSSLANHLKIIKFCAPADMEKCGMPSGNPTTFKDLYNTTKTSMPTTWSTITYPYGVTGSVPGDNQLAPYSVTNPTTQNYNNGYSFLTADGISVNLFYNPYCAMNYSDKMYYDSSSYTYTKVRPQFSLDTACMSGVYDMNGLKKPNQVGKDIGFFGVFYNGVQSTAVASLPYKEGVDTHADNWKTADAYCNGIKGYKLPTVDELSALYLGRNITGMPNNVWLWSASSLPASSSSYARLVYFDGGARYWHGRSTAGAVRCVRD